MHPIKIPMTLAIALTLTACAAPTVSTDLGPMKYDASGTMARSAGAPTYSSACGWRVLRKASGGAEIWIANIAVKDRATYRVLDFSGGEFSTRDGAKLQVSKNGDTWSVAVPGKEYYRFADALITGG